MNNYIRQCGVIESICGNKARIRTIRSSACDTCASSGTCNSKRGKDFHVDITDKRLEGHKPGDQIYIEMPARTGRHAIIVGFGLPLTIFAATLLLLHYTGSTDEWAALGGLGAIAVYYLIIYLIRGRVERHFTIHIAEK